MPDAYLPYDPVNPLVGLIPERKRTGVYKDCHICNLICNNQKLKTTLMAISRCMDNHVFVYQHKGTLFHNKKGGPIDSHNMKTKIIMLSEKVDKNNTG